MNTPIETDSDEIIADTRFIMQHVLDAALHRSAANGIGKAQEIHDILPHMTDEELCIFHDAFCIFAREKGVDLNRGPFIPATA